MNGELFILNDHESESEKLVTSAELAMRELRRSNAPTATLKSVAAALECDPRTVSAAIARGTIPAIKIGKRQLILREKFLKIFEVEDD